ncbi:MAG: hypothetical protein NTZ67_05315 [Gammaproteobacteria bacterium]|nr:hypothetical protein [Gammaproteobacteria bacterium]
MKLIINRGVAVSRSPSSEDSSASPSLENSSAKTAQLKRNAKAILSWCERLGGSDGAAVIFTVALFTLPITLPAKTAFDYFTRSNITQLEIDNLIKAVFDADEATLRDLCARIIAQPAKSKSSKWLHTALRENLTSSVEGLKELIINYLGEKHNAGKKTMQTTQNFFLSHRPSDDASGIELCKSTAQSSSAPNSIIAQLKSQA